MLEIRDLKHLLSIDEFRHFGRAASSVGLSQSALTKSLQRIEKALSAKLFDRSRAGVVPTKIGEEVLARGRVLVEEAEKLNQVVLSMTGEEIRSISVGVGPAMSESYVVAAIAEFAKQESPTQITVRVDHWQQLSEWLLSGMLDFYVADVSEAKIDGRFRYISLPPQEFVWFCRRDHPLASRSRSAITRSDLLRFPLAAPRFPQWVMEWFAAASESGLVGLPRAFPAVECESYAVLKQLVSSSDCVSAALEQTLTREVEDGSLVILPLDAPLLTTHAGIIRMADRSPASPAQQLIASIEQLAQSTAAPRRPVR